MEYLNSRNHFLEPDVNQPLPAVLEVAPPIPLRNPSRRLQNNHDSSTHLISTISSQNPFNDAANIVPPGSIRPLSKGKSIPGQWSNNHYHGTASMRSTAEQPDKAYKDAASTNSITSSKFSSHSGDPTSTSQIPSFEPSYPIGNNVNKPATSITTSPSDPFTDPKPNIPPLLKESNPSHKHSLKRSSVRDWRSSDDYLPRPPALAQGRQNQDVNNGHNISILSQDAYKFYDNEHPHPGDQRIREVAIKKHHLLALEQLKTNDSILETPRLYPSSRDTPQGDMGHSSSIRYGRGLVGSGVDGQNTGDKGIVKNTWFWVFFAMVQIGLISTGAAFAVMLRNKGVGESISIGSGTIFWLICSLAVAIIGVVGTLCIWGSQRGCGYNFLSRAGLLEMGLISDDGRTKSMVQKSFKKREKEDKRMLERLVRVREREKTRAGSVNRWNDVRTRDPMWQALYQTPEQLRDTWEKEDKYSLCQSERPMEMEIRAGDRVMKRSRGADTLLSGGNDLREFNESDIGVQMLNSRDRNPFSDKAQYSRYHDPDPRFPFSRLSPERHRHNRPQIRTEFSSNDSKLKTPFLEAASSSVGISHLPNNTKHKPASNNKNSSSSTSFSSPVSLSHGISPSAYVTTYPSSSNQSLPQHLKQGSSDVPLNNWSPLDNLARELNTPELRNRNASERVDYFASRRLVTEERGRKLRESMEKVTTSGKHNNQSASDGVVGEFDRTPILEGSEGKPNKTRKAERKPTITKKNLRDIMLVQERVKDFEQRSTSNDSGRHPLGERSTSEVSLPNCAEKGGSSGGEKNKGVKKLNRDVKAV